MSKDAFGPESPGWHLLLSLRLVQRLPGVLTPGTLGALLGDLDGGNRLLKRTLESLTVQGALRLVDGRLYPRDG